MNDRFKFRAWNKLSNEMKDVISLNINYEFPECSNVILETNTLDNIKTHNNPIACANGLNNVVLMQSTGLKDKNGKLIYEGDIVKTSKGIANVEYDNTYAYFGLTNFLTVFSFDNFINEEIEVIGNIYENKELLNENS